MSLPWYRKLALRLAAWLSCFGEGHHYYDDGRCIICGRSEDKRTARQELEAVFSDVSRDEKIVYSVAVLVMLALILTAVVKSLE